MVQQTVDTEYGNKNKRLASLRSKFLVLFVVLFLAGSALIYAVTAWFINDIGGRLGSWFAEKSVLYEKARVVQLLVREITLTQKMASSSLLKTWVKIESDPQAKDRAIAELEDFRHSFRSKSYFVAIARSGNYYFNDDKGGDNLEPRYTLDRSIAKDGWFYATLDKVADYKLNVDTDRQLKVTKVWINTVLRDEDKTLAVVGTGVDLSDFIQSVIATSQPGVTNVLLDKNGAIQAHRDVSIIDFSSIAKEQRNEQQSTLFNLLDDARDRTRVQEALMDLSIGKADTHTLQVSIQGKRHIAGIAYLPDIQWFIVSLAYPEAAQNPSYLAAMVAIRIAGLGIILLIIGIAFDRMVLRRLAQLDIAAKEVSAGNYAVQLPRRGSDELSRLGQTLQDMTERVVAHMSNLDNQVAERTRVLAQQAQADLLTGLLNRRGMGERIEIEKNRLAREGAKLGMLILDIDHFKQINDTHGQEVADQALVQVARTIRAAMRSYDLCSRWGGEEFLVIAPHIISRAALIIVAEKLRGEIKSKPIPIAGGKLNITVSIGGYFADPQESTDAIVKAADDALYLAKQGGRDRTVVTERPELG